MKKKELLNLIDEKMLDKLFGFSYVRTNNSNEAEALCSDIVFAIIKAANTDGEIENIDGFIWKIAHNVYADYSKNRKKQSSFFDNNVSEEILLEIPEENATDDTDELLKFIYQRIAFLTKAYRETMILYYLDGLSTSQIAKKLCSSDNTIRQRLFAAREKIKKEVHEMDNIVTKPMALDKVNVELWGNGSPAWGDPRKVFSRLFSKHIFWLCYKGPKNALEIANELNVPTIYVEEELEILCKGENGHYGLLRKLENGKYGINIIFLDKKNLTEATNIYYEQLPGFIQCVKEFISKHEEEYLAFPYLNKKVDMNLILWQQLHSFAQALQTLVRKKLKEDYFRDYTKISRPFSLFGYEDIGKHFGGGEDGIGAKNVCGYSYISLTNIYNSQIQAHFKCSHDIGNDPLIQLAIRSIDGIDIAKINSNEEEYIAKAIECGYLYREGKMVYTKILVNRVNDSETLFKLANQFYDEYENGNVDIIASKIAKLIYENIPDYLLPEWDFVNTIASMPMVDGLMNALIGDGLLTPPENGIGAEGCWMEVDS